MKKNLPLLASFFLCLPLLVPARLSAQCPVILPLGTQTQVDAFAATLILCGGIVPELTLQTQSALADPINDLSPLSGLTEVTGDLSIADNPALLTLAGLENLTRTGGTLNLARNAGLQTTAGLAGLEEVAGSFIVDTNDDLQDLDGLTSLTSVGQQLLVFTNAGLETLSGLSSLTNVGSNLQLQTNIALTNLDGLSNLATTGGNLEINNSRDLTDISGLASLTEVSTTFSLNNNNSLTNLDGLLALTTVGNNLRIVNNDLLENLDGIGALASVGGSINVTNNSVLSRCSTDLLCTRVPANDNVKVSGNSGACADEPAVTAACIALPVEWLSFAAVATPKYVELTWATAREDNNAGFRVERSSGGSPWTVVGEAAPKPTQGVRTYLFRDASATGGEQLYRLAQLDFDGTVNYSEVRSVVVNTEAFAAYPNPFGTEISIFSEPADTYLIYDAGGREVASLSHSGGGAKTFSSGLRGGTYWLHSVRTGRVVALEKY